MSETIHLSVERIDPSTGTLRRSSRNIDSIELKNAKCGVGQVMLELLDDMHVELDEPLSARLVGLDRTPPILLVQPAYTYLAQVVTVHDGDTFTCDFDLGMRVWMRNQTVRFARLNAPELNRPDGAGEKVLAALNGWLMEAQMQVVIRTHKDETEKWRRWLGEVFALDKTGHQYSINQRLLDEGLAVKMG